MANQSGTHSSHATNIIWPHKYLLMKMIVSKANSSSSASVSAQEQTNKQTEATSEWTQSVPFECHTDHCRVTSSGVVHRIIKLNDDGDNDDCDDDFNQNAHLCMPIAHRTTPNRQPTLYEPSNKKQSSSGPKTISR